MTRLAFLPSGEKNTFDAPPRLSQDQRDARFSVSEEMWSTVYWVGRSPNAAAFGNAWDVWSKDLADPNSIASKLWARFLDCSTNVSRRGYDVY